MVSNIRGVEFIQFRKLPENGLQRRSDIIADAFVAIGKRILVVGKLKKPFEYFLQVGGRSFMDIGTDLGRANQSVIGLSCFFVRAELKGLKYVEKRPYGLAERIQKDPGFPLNVFN